MSAPETDESNSETPDNNWNPQNEFVVDIFNFISFDWRWPVVASWGEQRAQQIRRETIVAAMHSCGRRMNGGDAGGVMNALRYFIGYRIQRDHHE